MSRRFLITVGTCVGLTLMAGQAAAERNDAETYRLLNLFGDVFERVRAEYVEEVTDKELIEAALQGMLTSLDPHSSYLNADHFREMQVQTKGEFGGLGIEVTMEEGLVKVVSPIDGTPAFQAGIQPGDFITHLDGEPVMGLSLNEAVDQMRGPVGTNIDLTIRREGTEPFDVTITRDIVRIDSVRSELFDNIGYLRVTSFNEHTYPELEEGIEALKAEAGEDLAGLVLDLRNNPGGLLDQAVAVADAFLDHGEIVSTRSRRAEETQRFNAREGDLADGLPLVVLINSGSASASEIVAGALQDHRRAIVLGTKSFGKGSVQTIIPLPGHGAMRLTTARYYTPSGRSIQAMGIDPDIQVQQAKVEVIAVDERFRRSEADLRGALDNDTVDDEAAEPSAGAADAPEDGQEPEAPDAGPVVQLGDPDHDYQLARAVDLLEGLALYQTRLAAN